MGSPLAPTTSSTTPATSTQRSGDVAASAVQAAAELCPGTAGSSTQVLPAPHAARKPSVSEGDNRSNWPSHHRHLMLDADVVSRPASAPPELSMLPYDDADVTVDCQARARIPSERGEFYLHLYRNDRDNKEHLAVVYGEDLRSASLDAPRDGETELDRIVRGAYVGRLRREHAIGAPRTSPAVLRRSGATKTNGSPAAAAVGRAHSGANGHAKANGHHRPDRPSSDEEEKQSALMYERSALHVASSSSSSSTTCRPSSRTSTESKATLCPPLVRIHSECFTGETLGSIRCDCREQLVEAMRMMAEEGRGIVVYLRQEGRGIGLLDKLRAYNLQDLGHDTVTANLLLSHPADARTYGIASKILADIGAEEVRLLTNNPDKIKQLEVLGISVSERVPMVPKAWKMLAVESGQSTPPRERFSEVDEYLKAKVERMRHLLDLPLDLAASVVQAGVAPIFSATSGAVLSGRASPVASAAPDGEHRPGILH